MYLYHVRCATKNPDGSLTVHPRPSLLVEVPDRLACSGKGEADAVTRVSLLPDADEVLRHAPEGSELVAERVEFTSGICQLA